MTKLLALSAGGLVGTFLRVGVTAWLAGLEGGRFPYGTLAVNLSACFLIGVFNAVLGARAGVSPELRLLLVTGFCGAYSTFSTLILETAYLADGGHALRALTNWLASGAAGYLLFRLGAALALAAG